METLAERVATIREAKGLTQQGLSEKASVPQSAISDIETGKRKNPGAVTLQKIAIALGVNITELLSESGQQPTKLPRTG